MTTRLRSERAVDERIDDFDWTAIAAGLDDVGVSLTPPVLDARRVPHARRTSTTTTRASVRRSTWLGHRFGEGQYRYFSHPLPELVTELRAAFWPHLLPIARDWSERRGQPAPWPDDLDEWLEQCHAAGQTRPTPLMLRYEAGDWNALHRDLYGDLVFPLQVVVGLARPGDDFTGGEFVVVEQRPRAQSRATATADPGRSRARVHHPRPPDPNHARLVERADAPRSEHRAQRPTDDARPHLSRRHVNVTRLLDAHRADGSLCEYEPAAGVTVAAGSTAGSIAAPHSPRSPRRVRRESCLLRR